MNYDIAGNQIIEPTPNCDCGFTGGCEKCNPALFTNIFYKESKKWNILDEIPISEADYDYYEKLIPKNK